MAMRAGGGVSDGLVKCEDCARHRLVGHRSQSTRSEWSMIHRREYARGLGCGLTGERLAAHKPRRCGTFEARP